nr:MAG TPA: hypothetical protein [Caudoviricetes sp.]
MYLQRFLFCSLVFLGILFYKKDTIFSCILNIKVSPEFS